MNKRIREVVGQRESPTEFICECADEDCIETISLGREEYEAAHANPVLFVLLPGHELLEAERIVHQTDRFVTVEKAAEAGIAARNDPRSPTNGGVVLMTTRYERLVENQHSFRHANERFHQVLSEDGGAVDGRLIPFLCECADNNCPGRVEATLTEYEVAHFTRDDYFILRGHHRVEGEEIIAEHDGYDIVRKEAASAL